MARQDISIYSCKCKNESMPLEVNLDPSEADYSSRALVTRWGSIPTLIRIDLKDWNGMIQARNHLIHYQVQNLFLNASRKTAADTVTSNHIIQRNSLATKFLPSIIARRRISCTRATWHGQESVDENAPRVKVHWINKHGDAVTTDAPVGMNLMRVAHKYGIELEGACEGVCACSTCHVILEENVYSSLPEPSEDEDDMLDQAFGLTATSRLGCQVLVTPDMDNIRVQLPSATRNFYVDGHVPVPH